MISNGLHFIGCHYCYSIEWYQKLFNPVTLEEDELSSALRTNERQTPEVRGHSYTNKRHCAPALDVCFLRNHLQVPKPKRFSKSWCMNRHEHWRNGLWENWFILKSGFLFYYFFFVFTRNTKKGQRWLEPWLQTSHLSCPTFMGGLYLEPWFGLCLELFKREALYKSESNKARGISAISSALSAQEMEGLDWNTKMEKCLQENQ